MRGVDELAAADVDPHVAVAVEEDDVSGLELVTKENWSIASSGNTIPAIPFTPPWLTAGMFHHKSLLSVPSICQFTELVRVPFTEAKPAPPFWL